MRQPSGDLSKASPAGQHPLRRGRSSRASGSHTDRNPADFRCETVQWQGFNGLEIRLQKIPNLKALFPKVSSGSTPPAAGHEHARLHCFRGKTRDSTDRAGPTAAGRIEAPGRPAPPDAGRARRQLCAHRRSVLLIYCLRRHHPDRHSVGLFPVRRRIGRDLRRAVGSPASTTGSRTTISTIFQVGGHVALQLCFPAGGARNRHLPSSASYSSSSGSARCE